MRQMRGIVTMMGGIAFAALFAITACTTGYTPKNAPESFACVFEGKLEKDIAPEAELSALTCTFKEYERVQTLHFKGGIKNISNKNQRYRIHFFLDNGKAVGGLLPAEVKKGLVKPGDTATFVYPVLQMPRQPKTVTVRVSTVTD